MSAEFAASALFLARRTANAPTEGEQGVICTGDEHKRCNGNDRNQQARQQCGTVPGGHRCDRHGRSDEPGQDEERYLRPVPPPVTHPVSLLARAIEAPCGGNRDIMEGPESHCDPPLNEQTHTGFLPLVHSATACPSAVTFRTALALVR